MITDKYTRLPCKHTQAELGRARNDGERVYILFAINK